MLKQRARDRLYKRSVGLLVIFSAIAVLIFLRLYQQTAGPFKETIPLVATVERADGIALDAPVTMAGIKVGRVTAINLTDDNRVRLDLEIEGQVRHKLRADSRATLSKPLLGSAFVDIAMGSPNQPVLQGGSALPIRRAPDINDLVATLPDRLAKIDATLDNLSAVSADLRRTSQQATASGGPVERTLAHVQNTARHAEHAAERLNTTLDETRQVVRTTGIAVQQVGAILADVKDGTVKLAPILDKTNRALDDVQAVTGELRATAPQIAPVVAAGRDTLQEADEVLRAAKNSFLLRGSAPPPAAPPALPAPR